MVMKISYTSSHTCAIWVLNIVNKNKLYDTSAIYCMIWYQKAIPEERLPNNSSSKIVSDGKLAMKINYPV
jgi:hypothetical protein